MYKRTIIWIVAVIAILAGSIYVCVLRWDAWFAMPEEPVWEGDTLSMRFVTFNDDTTYDCQYADTLSMIVLGDVHNTLQTLDYMGIAAQHPDIQCYAQLGDFVEREQFYYKQLLKHQLYATLFDSLPVLVCPGNHEYTKGVNRQLPDSWYESFPMPQNGPMYSKGSTYYVDFRNMRFIAIDTEDPLIISDYTRLNAWAKYAISSACQPWVVVMMHRPVFASRKGRVNPTIWLSLVRALKDADVIFSGHDHTYARRGDVLQTEDEPHQPVWIGVGSTTHTRTPKERSHMDTIVADVPCYEYMRVTRHELTVHSCQLDGTPFDSIAIIKR